ncbi:MAG: DUF6476 family protein [Pseudotabrizicola sp.]|uniref:DUF6476 family protein n=1 Tax=Pseudotabrizicola sp. TaxID=2939647 RepID=UPI002730FA9D|nr:DUF6476 family protein [Pseudotabrizicola sp.]MDP2082986.1 DUF6476 family protein [Pseudotabrizicola sp.]MDZ7574518.1 DUF6476 family protein [Pseudotabrizicola sp.]
MNNTPETEALPPSLRLLKWLVMVLTATMIVGVITVVGLLVTRMPNLAPMAMPDRLALPEGVRPAAVTMGQGFIAVVTDDDRILIFGRDGTIWQEVEVIPRANTGAQPVQP